MKVKLCDSIRLCLAYSYVHASPGGESSLTMSLVRGQELGLCLLACLGVGCPSPELTGIFDGVPPILSSDNVFMRP
jgi:hypothetical protein